MANFHALWICYFISTCTTDMLPSMVGNVYSQMSYNSTGSPLAHLTIRNKLLCAAQCANQFVNCSTAVFDRSAILQCLLFSEVVMLSNLVVSINAVVYDFQQSKHKATVVSFRWKTTGVTVAGASTGVAGVAANLLSHTYGLALDSSNSLYIADSFNNRIQKWLINASNGTTVAGLANGTGSASSVALNTTVSIVLDSDNNMYFTDRSNHRVVFWANGASNGTTFAGITGYAGSENNTFNGPSAIARDSSSGTLYIADTYNHRVMKYLSNASSGTVVAGGNGAGTNNTQLWLPFGMTFDSVSNSVLIANYGAHNIVRWVLGTSNWILVAGSISGLNGSTSTLLNQPLSVALDSMGNVYVADSYNHRIQFFRAGQFNGTTIGGITGSFGTNSSQLNYPYWAIIDNQMNLYVGDTDNNRVQMFLHY